MSCPKCNNNIMLVEPSVFNLEYNIRVGREYCPSCSYSIWEYKTIGVPPDQIVANKPDKQYWIGKTCVICNKYIEFGKSYNQKTCSEICSRELQRRHDHDKYLQKRKVNIPSTHLVEETHQCQHG